MNISQYKDPTSNTNDIYDLVLRAMEKYKNYPSIKLIKTNSENNASFRFQEIQAIEIEKELKNLDCSKTHISPLRLRITSTYLYQFY